LNLLSLSIKHEYGGKMKRMFYGIVAVCLIALPASLQGASVSQATLLFLKIAPGARPSGMGEAFVAIADDASATWWNPAGQAFQRGHELTMMYVRWLPQFNLSDLYYAFLSGVYEVPEWGTFGANLMFLNLGETERRDENNRDLGKFSSDRRR
jgi:hypothetical protein